MAVPVARVIVVADAFLAELNTALFAWGVTTPATPPEIPPLPPVPLVAARKYVTQYATDDLLVLHVDVQVLTQEAELNDRDRRVANLYGFNVVVQQQVAVDATAPIVKDGVLVLAAHDTAAVTARIDELVKLVVAIFENWKQEDHIGDLTTVHLVESQPFLYSPDLLEAGSRFMGAAMFIFREVV